ncbi:MAG: N-acetylmuramoyl-L-alanine amidase [Lentisphaeria bacterium]|nr:N-acetylmuramoyl-L-alanine amidase [Lentisphaeria bacterium]
MKYRFKVACRSLLAGAGFCLLLPLPAMALNGKIPASRNRNGVYRGAAETAADRNWAFHDTGDGAFELACGDRRLTFRQNRRTATFNGRLIHLNFQPFRDPSGRWFLHVRDIEQTADALLNAPAPAVPLRRIILDPGHGGSDPGARGTELLEKNLNLHIARLVADILRKRGFEVILTRSDDRFLALPERPRRITRHNADLFVSIHQNADPRKQGRGIETFVTTPAHCASSPGPERHTDDRPTPGNRFDRQSLQLAASVQNRLIEATGAVDRGVKRRRFAVVREADCPAILVECGFISTPAEHANMLDQAWRIKIATAIADGISDCAGREPDK